MPPPNKACSGLAPTVARPIGSWLAFRSPVNIVRSAAQAANASRYVSGCPMSLRIVSIELDEANVLVESWHRHHDPVVGHRYSIGAYDTKKQKMVGAVIVGRPVSRMMNKRVRLEVTRLVTDGTKNACSFLYAAAARVGKELGYEKIHTYILDSETGVSLLAAGWYLEKEYAGGGHGWHNRPGRNEDQPETPKQRWAKVLNPPMPRKIVTKHNTACTRPPFGVGKLCEIPLQAPMFADDSPATFGGG
jgi:hypothetical protein